MPMYHLHTFPRPQHMAIQASGVTAPTHCTSGTQQNPPDTVHSHQNGRKHEQKQSTTACLRVPTAHITGTRSAPTDGFPHIYTPWTLPSR